MRAAATTAAKGASWMSLLAATSLGVASAGAVRATVRADDPHVAEVVGDMRLIVQTYARESLNDDLLPRHDARPRASAQRAVTPEELARGVQVSMVDLDHAGADGAIVVAWIEKGAPNLEYDALTARPQKGAYFGVAAGDVDNGVPIVLRRA